MEVNGAGRAKIERLREQYYKEEQARVLEDKNEVNLVMLSIERSE